MKPQKIKHKLKSTISILNLNLINQIKNKVTNEHNVPGNLVR